MDVVVRTRDELAEVVERNPLGDVADNPKRYQVSFLSEPPDPDVVADLTKLVHESERLVADGRELYAWHPEGVARSKLWAALAGTKLGVTATARNWTTVTTLLEMADGSKLYLVLGDVCGVDANNLVLLLNELEDSTPG